MHASAFQCTCTSKYNSVLFCFLDSAFLATCSEDGSIRLWGLSGPIGGSGEIGEKEDMSLGVIERFLGLGWVQYPLSRASSYFFHIFWENSFFLFWGAFQFFACRIVCILLRMQEFTFQISNIS
jgi:hypothetical protein